MNVEPISFPFDQQHQLNSQLEGIKLETSVQTTNQSMGYQNQINNLPPKTPDVFVASQQQPSNVIGGVGMNLNGDHNDRSETKSNEQLLNEKAISEQKAPQTNLQNYQQFTSSYTPSNQPIQSSTTLFNPNFQQLAPQSPQSNLPPQSMPNYQSHQQLPTSQTATGVPQFTNYPINQPMYTPGQPPQFMQQAHSNYSPHQSGNQPPYSPPQPPISQQQQSFIHNLPTQSNVQYHQSNSPVPSSPQDSSTRQQNSGPPHSNVSQQTNLQSSAPPQANFVNTLPSNQPPSNITPSQAMPPQSMTGQSRTPTNLQQQSNLFTTPINLPNMPPLNVSIDNSKIPLSNLEFETIINNKNQ